MRMLIVGSKGFIGLHALDYFKEKHEVWGCDIFTNYNERNFFLLDTFNPSYNAMFQSQAFDVCINCAGAASVPDSFIHPERDYELNVHLVFKLLDSIRQHNPKCKFINISSAAVYGNPRTLPVNEDHLLDPLSPYGLHKMYAEQLCREFTIHFGLMTCSVRVFSAFGPGLRKQILWDLFRKSKKESRVTLFGNGNETRDYIFVDDIVSALDCIIAKNPFECECYNVGYGKQSRLKDVVALFFDSLNWHGDVQFTGEKRIGDPDFWQADISRLSALGFSPRITIEEGIKKYVEWAKSVSSD